MKKRIHLKDNVKETICFILAAVAMVILVCFYTYRIDSINNNPDGYTDAGRNHSVNVQLTR